jgi:hypothetical protein
MEAQHSAAVNYPRTYFQDQSGPGHYPAFAEWHPVEDISMNEPDLTISQTQLFELGFHTLGGRVTPKETAKTLSPESLSVSVELPSPKNEKVHHIAL